MGCHRTEWIYFQKDHPLISRIYQRLVFRRLLPKMTIWSQVLANGDLDICGRQPTTWCTPNYVMPSSYSKVLESQTLSSSRASAGTLIGRRGKCREYNHRRMASLNFGALGRSYMLTIGVYETDTFVIPHLSLGHYHISISFPILPIFIYPSLLPSSLSSHSQHNSKHCVVMAAEKGVASFCIWSLSRRYGVHRKG